jgi:hypothetical protein
MSSALKNEFSISVNFFVGIAIIRARFLAAIALILAYFSINLQYVINNRLYLRFAQFLLI